MWGTKVCSKQGELLDWGKKKQNRRSKKKKKKKIKTKAKVNMIRNCMPNKRNVRKVSQNKYSFFLLSS